MINIYLGSATLLFLPGSELQNGEVGNFQNGADGGETALGYGWHPHCNRQELEEAN